MLAATDHAGAARAILDTDIETLQALRVLLLEERTALTARDPADLDHVVQHKSECLQRMQQNDVARRHLLTRLGSSSWVALLAQLDPTLGTAWESLQPLLDEVAELGRTNERIVSRMQRSSARLLALLRGQPEKSADALYDRSGQAHGRNDQHLMTRA